jgi:hypothetical protein
MDKNWNELANEIECLKKSVAALEKVTDETLMKYCTREQVDDICDNFETAWSMLEVQRRFCERLDDLQRK